MPHEPHPITHAQGLLEGVLRSLDKTDEINKEGLKRVLVEVVGLLKEGWISVDEQLPEEMECVLGCHIEAGGIEKMFYVHEESKWFASDASDNFERLITHWMPLPNLPEKQ